MVEKIGVIGGNGWLGGALIQSAVSRGAVDAARLWVSSRSGSKGAIGSIGLNWARDNEELVARSDVVILSVPPARFPDLRLDLSSKLVISVMAGVNSARIAAQTRAKRIVRSLPNAAAAIGKSFTPWHASPEVSAADRALVQRFFDATGEGAEVPLEAHIDYLTGMTGSGAAFPALLAEALVADAVARGLPHDFAARAAKGVVCSASQLLANADTAAIVQEMIDYKGVIAAALQAMLTNGFKQAVAAGMEAAVEKTAMMGKAGP